MYIYIHVYTYKYIICNVPLTSLCSLSLSPVVGKDASLDYEYDSEAEWSPVSPMLGTLTSPSPPPYPILT